MNKNFLLALCCVATGFISGASSVQGSGASSVQGLFDVSSEGLVGLNRPPALRPPSPRSDWAPGLHQGAAAPDWAPAPDWGAPLPPPAYAHPDVLKKAEGLYHDGITLWGQLNPKPSVEACLAALDIIEKMQSADPRIQAIKPNAWFFTIADLQVCAEARKAKIAEFKSGSTPFAQAYKDYETLPVERQQHLARFLGGNYNGLINEDEFVSGVAQEKALEERFQKLSLEDRDLLQAVDIYSLADDLAAVDLVERMHSDDPAIMGIKPIPDSKRGDRVTLEALQKCSAERRKAIFNKTSEEAKRREALRAREEAFRRAVNTEESRLSLATGTLKKVYSEKEREIQLAENAEKRALLEDWAEDQELSFTHFADTGIDTLPAKEKEKAEQEYAAELEQLIRDRFVEKLAEAKDKAAKDSVCANEREFFEALVEHDIKAHEAELDALIPLMEAKGVKFGKDVKPEITTDATTPDATTAAEPTKSYIPNFVKNHPLLVGGLAATGLCSVALLPLVYKYYNEKPDMTLYEYIREEVKNSFWIKCALVGAVGVGLGGVAYKYWPAAAAA